MSLYVPSDISGISNWHDTKSLHRTLDMARTRLLVICGSFILIFLMITVRLVDVSLLKRSGENTFDQSHIQKPVFRADIVDRNGELLATSLRTSSLYANARVVLDPKEAAQKLVQVLPELNYNDALHRLQSGKGFVWLARHLTPQKQAEILRLGLPGIYFQQDERRVYPHGELFAHVLGYTNIDNQGLSGIERKFNDLLLSHGSPFALSLDVRVQHIVRDELLAGIEKFKAQGGAGLVMNVQTGEIIAMVSLPDFDPNHVNKIGSQKQALFNRLALGVYEMGSNFKIFTTALFLDKGKSSVHTKLDVSGPLRVGRFRITDIHPAHYPLTVTEIFVQSSNIGAAKMAMYLGSQLQQEFFKKLGFFQSPQLEIPELGSPLFPKQWSEPTLITASYGYGISITPLHLATAIGGIVNKGIMQQPTLLKKDQGYPAQGKRVVSEKTSEIMRKLLYMVVAQGTGKKAGVKGYEVGGKTGTANQLVGKSYKDGTSTTSFTGVFPMTDPKYLVLIMVDRPQGIKETYGFNLGGWNAAPITGKVIRRIAPILQVIPTHKEVDEAGQNPLLIQACATQQEAL
jgi:cell division protein FtsI (penicillin-binding protein 3)